MRSKAKLLLARHAGVEDAVLETRLAQEASRLEALFAGHLAFGRGYAVGDAALYQIAAGGFNAADRPFDAMMEIVVEGGGGMAEFIPLLNGFADRLSDLVDPLASAGHVGTEHVILPGSGPLLVMIANRRLPNFTHEGFIDYWFHNHGALARDDTPTEVGLRYRQFHADVAATRQLCRVSGLAIDDFDGASECYFSSADSIRHLMGFDEVVDKATQDEKKFVDHDRCVTSVLAITQTSTSHLIA